jgi:hypothetical protein
MNRYQIYARRLEPKIGNTHGTEENLHEFHKTTQSETVVSNHAFHLMEFTQVSCIDGLVSELESAITLKKRH